MDALRILLKPSKPSGKQRVAPSSVVQMVQAGGGETLVPMLFTLLRRDYSHLFPGNRRILTFSPAIALLWDMHRRFRSAGIQVWTPPRSEHAVRPEQDTDEVAAAPPMPEDPEGPSAVRRHFGHV